jgi:DNA-directed RNA polymerase specialized sigma24 family protein
MHHNVINRLREHPDANSSRQRFHAQYQPMLRNWLRRYCLQPHDADDLVQRAHEVVARKLPLYEYDPRSGTFPA